MELSIALFFLVLSGVLVAGAITAKSMGDRLLVAIDQQSSQYSQLAVEISRVVKSASQQYVDTMAAQAKQQRELLKAAQDMETVLQEGGFAIGARVLEAQGLLPHTEANQIVGDAIGRVNARSPRLGLFAKSINDAYLTKTSR